MREKTKSAMDAERKLPDFYQRESPVTSSWTGLLLLLPVLLCLYLSFTLPKKDLVDWRTFFMALVFAALGLLLVFNFFFMAAYNHRAKAKWFRDASIEQATILTREEIGGPGGELPFSRVLKLEPTPRQSQELGETFISVGIKENQYQYYEGKRRVTIYCSRTDPLVFLLEDEV
jgi:hypothetical protein